MKSAIPADAGSPSGGSLSRSGRGLLSAGLLVVLLHAWALVEWAEVGERHALQGSPVPGLFRVLELMPPPAQGGPAMAGVTDPPAPEPIVGLGAVAYDPDAVGGVEALATAGLADLGLLTPSAGAVDAASSAPIHVDSNGESGGASGASRAAGLRHASEAEPVPDVLMLDGQAYWPSRALQRTPLPSSSPDLTLLRGVATSGLPVQVRVFIDAQGIVREVTTLQAGEIDAEFVDRLRRMFLRTRFVPGMRAGQAVAGYRDLEFSITAVHD